MDGSLMRCRRANSMSVGRRNEPSRCRWMSVLGIWRRNSSVTGAFLVASGSDEGLVIGEGVGEGEWAVGGACLHQIAPIIAQAGWASRVNDSCPVARLRPKSEVRRPKEGRDPKTEAVGQRWWNEALAEAPLRAGLAGHSAPPRPSVTTARGLVSSDFFFWVSAFVLRNSPAGLPQAPVAAPTFSVDCGIAF